MFFLENYEQRLPHNKVLRQMPIQLRERTNDTKNRLIKAIKEHRYHFIVWSVFIAYEILIAGIFSGYYSSFTNYALHYFFNILLFYSHAFLLFETLWNGKYKWSKLSLPLLILIEIALYVLVVYSFEIFFTKYLHIVVLQKTAFSKAYVSRTVWRGLYFIGFSTAYYVILRNQYRKQQMEEMERQKLLSIIQQEEIKNELMRTQNAYLKSQINPHFLINTLSHLYNETRKLAPKAAESIISLSDMMQYALSKEVAMGMMRLHDEIKLVENYLHLHQARQVHPAELSLEYDEECQKLNFIPLVLMTLVENILKHGRLDQPDHPAVIRITVEDNILHIHTSNLRSVNPKASGHGMGLKNIKERLIQSYGDHATFEYGSDENKYFNTDIFITVM